jgi:hypothetical protein
LTIYLYSTSYLDGFDLYGSSRLARTRKYLDYYIPLQAEFGFDKIYLADDHSNLEEISDIESMYNPEQVIIHRFAHKAEGNGLNFEYPWNWRGLWHLKNLIECEAAEKIIWIETDGFVLNSKLAGHIKNLNTGWSALWCKKWGFPETACQVLCRDSFQILFSYARGPYQNFRGRCFETSLPFTKIMHEFNSDRFGEYSLPQNESMDFYGQAPVKVELRFNHG